MSLSVRSIFLWSINLALFMCMTSAQACTDFKLTAADGSLLITRSMEFAQDLQSNLRSSPRGRVFKTTTINDKPGLSWQAKYGYISVDGFQLDACFDGMNEAGLTFEYLYLPGETEYQNIPLGKDHQAIPYTQFGDWVLSNFKTIDEVKLALNDVYVVKQLLPQLGSAILPAHASIYDSSGKGIVVEFYNNKINVFEHIGVMTNSPKYDWHITNLQNYINLSPNNAETIVQNGISYTSLGQGSGAVGIPGDASPPSRFVKIAFMVKNVYQAKNNQDLLNLAEHIINNVDLPAGYVRSGSGEKTITDITQWVVFKDITHKKFYYRTYNDMTLHVIDMEQVDFAENAPRLKMPIVSNYSPINNTADFLKAKQ